MAIVRETVSHYLEHLFIDLLLPIVVGLICGLEAILIRTVIPVTFAWVAGAADVNDKLGVPVIFACLMGGAYLAGLLFERMRETSGVGLDVAIESYHSKAGMLPAKFPPLKFAATFLTLGLGGSGGLVGPTAVIGQGTASYFSKWLRLSQDRSRKLALCAIAGCVSGLLHTPFGAAVLALELQYMGSIVYEDLIPVLSASISAYVMSAHLIRLLPIGDLFRAPYLFRTIAYDTAFPWSLDYLAYCIIAALFTALLAASFIKTFLALQSFSEREINSKYRAVAGAGLVGLIATLFFRHRLADVLSDPGDLVKHCATEGYLLGPAAVLLIGRWVTTFLTVGFGGSGGLFSPTVLMGGLSGTIVARLLGIASPRVLVTTGMAAALVGVMNVPMAAVIIVAEAFGVGFILPAAIGSAIAFLLCKRMVIYPNILKYGDSAKEQEP